MTMTPNEAYKLAEMMAKTWRNGPLQAAWSDLMQKHCEHDLAWQTFEQFRDTDDRPPGTSSFLATYRRNAGLNHTDRARQARCATCDGTGLRSARQRIGPSTYDVVVACADCSAGVGAARVLTSIDSANAAHAGPERQHDVGPVVVGAVADSDDTERISFGEYLARLSARGDPMLDVWEANLQRMPTQRWRT